MHDHTTIKGIYLVMEHVKNDLESIIYDREKMLNQRQALTLAYGLLRAVKYLHSANLMHRDLKPSNILVTSDLQVKICDFGLTRSERLTETEHKKAREFTAVCFTRYYRPPEVILLSHYDHRADLWSVGCILAEIFQATALEQNQRYALFEGESCFPMSPNVNLQTISQNDQLLKILTALTPADDEFDFATDDYSKVFLQKALEFTRNHPSDSQYSTIKSAVDPKAFEVIDILLKVAPQSRGTITEAMNHPLFDKVRQPETEIEANFKIETKVDLRPINQQTQQVEEYSDKKLKEYLGKLVDRIRRSHQQQITVCKRGSDS